MGEQGCSNWMRTENKRWSQHAMLCRDRAGTNESIRPKLLALHWVEETADCERTRGGAGKNWIVLKKKTKRNIGLFFLFYHDHDISQRDMPAVQSSVKLTIVQWVNLVVSRSILVFVCWWKPLGNWNWTGGLQANLRLHICLELEGLVPERSPLMTWVILLLFPLYYDEIDRFVFYWNVSTDIK